MEDSPQVACLRARKALRQRLESLQRSGVEHLKQSKRREGSVPPVPVAPGPATTAPIELQSPAIAPATGRSPVAEAPRADGPANEPLIVAETSATLRDPAALLQSLCKEVAACRQCAELADRRKQTVFGVGNPHARLCFLGEAPGADEDAQGEPFVGAAGQLLNRILAACGLRREDVYILNVLKCRPPGNRTPWPEEVANCRAYFERQLDVIRPEFICCLGAVAAQSLLRTTRSLGQLRGKFYQYGHSKVMVTYHPAYLLRTPDMKRATWDDIKMLLGEMGVEIPKP
jgi:DNA polymerase